MTNPTLIFLNQVRDNLDHVDYSLIYQSIKDLRDKMVPTAILRKGWFIDRVRPNEKGEIFSNKEQVSYIHDKQILESRVVYGRANESKQAVFYGSIISPKIKMPRAVAYFETSTLLKEIDSKQNIEEVFTMSRWRIMEDIEVVQMIFSEEALKVSEYAQRSLANQLKNYQHLPLAQHYEEQGKFFSNEFARDDIGKDEEYKYKISSAYANYLWNNTPYQGITYPSVPLKYLGQNVALLPNIVDTHLALESVAMFKFERINETNYPIDSFKIATDLGINQMDFQWVDYVGKDHQEQ